MSKDIVVLTSENWQKEVMESEVPILVDFWAEWCAPCRMIAPALEQIAASYLGKARVGKLNVDESPEVAGAFNIRSIPTLLVFKGGQVVEQRVGALPGPMIAEMLDKQVAAGASAGQA